MCETGFVHGTGPLNNVTIFLSLREVCEMHKWNRTRADNAMIGLLAELVQHVFIVASAVVNLLPQLPTQQYASDGVTLGTRHVNSREPSCGGDKIVRLQRGVFMEPPRHVRIAPD